MSNHLANFRRLVCKQTKCLFLLGLVVCVSIPGCFNANAMIEKRRAIAILTRLEEVDLGEFRISIPRPSDEVAAAEIIFHAFGQVKNRDLKLVQSSLEIPSPDLRHRLLIASRSLSIQDLEDPKLSQLRENIASVINEDFEDDPVQSVGFYKFLYSDL